MCMFSHEAAMLLSGSVSFLSVLDEDHAEAPPSHEETIAPLPLIPMFCDQKPGFILCGGHMLLSGDNS